MSVTLVSMTTEDYGPWLRKAEAGARERRKAFVYDFAIFERFRRQGYGSQAFQALEGRVLALGIRRIELHVFGHNLAARRLYQKLGYRETNVHMQKDL